MCEAFTSSTHACCAALCRVATLRLAAFSQVCTRWGLARAGILDLPMARTHSAARCARIAGGTGGATSAAPAGGGPDVLVPAVDDLLVPAVDVLLAPAVDDLLVPAVAGAPVAAVEVPVAAVDAAPLVDVTVLVLL